MWLKGAERSWKAGTQKSRVTREKCQLGIALMQAGPLQPMQDTRIHADRPLGRNDRRSRLRCLGEGLDA